MLEAPFFVTGAIVHTRDALLTGQRARIATAHVEIQIARAA